MYGVLNVRAKLVLIPCSTMVTRLDEMVRTSRKLCRRARSYYAFCSISIDERDVRLLRCFSCSSSVATTILMNWLSTICQGINM